jgi:hypothetical protein
MKEEKERKKRGERREMIMIFLAASCAHGPLSLANIRCVIQPAIEPAMYPLAILVISSA